MSNYRNDEVARLASMCKALGNTHRLRIFQRLMSCCTPGTVCALEGASPNCVGELGTELDIAASTLSHHIKTLAQAGLIHLHRRGQFVDCHVDPAAAALFGGLFKSALSTARRRTTKRK
jgi:ArsR family transcriptional regulator